MVAQVEPTAKPEITRAVTVPEVNIRQYEARDQKAVEALFAAGMLFYARMYADVIPDALARSQAYVQQSTNDDLVRIDDVYLLAGGNFWVAAARDPDGDAEKVIGMVGLQAKESGTGELRRMAVDPAYHRFGLGRRLVAHLEGWAKANGFTRVQLSTGSIMSSACKFYPSIGYEHVKTVAGTDELRIDALFFAKTL